MVVGRIVSTIFVVIRFFASWHVGTSSSLPLAGGGRGRARF
jgi:hypothetical protein